ncbi:MAG: hypothetical protein KZQ66_10925, partial [Candidatus Thiodiazotropha sp. (ex Lucinoma aequizonata)]|nr:hypothetical protein [Candidatus Thiodiazotropha sp. (ex Lucinoma aequizonata)]MCU7895667.1 hypothetical protein [Candidatus Thiodiazotropha sp. (ex Lucinoma aequizonata)]MCU7898703.1 hypothetical protein [Candidatus Thiodiazotropha sp. (ex Lucinoma aequizonata)]MCU7902437.1 hypothetical protein [Candidatus Thiodiazotropha sp. (ex Lucinoma aequizonata)]MCU7908218.1 hypothetical protein [Candidatus Thiodiazotropha sp. (ex Lucinoma aequizonata)]
MSNSGIYQPFIDTNRQSTMSILLAGETKTTVKIKTVTIQPILPWPTRLGLMHLHEIRFFALKKQ